MLMTAVDRTIRLHRCRWRVRRAAGMLLLCLLVTGCGQPAPETQDTHGQLRRVEKDGFRLPLFDSAVEQLNYAKSLLANAREKTAALRLLIDRFPTDRVSIGEARLELAYLMLGEDYRLAPPESCRAALAAYETIVDEFRDIPAVQVKAYWYMGWIHTDLLKETEKGLAFYTDLAANYPEDHFSRISPVPWLKLIFPDPNIKPYTIDDEFIHSWAGLALLEIVRNADSEARRIEAFELLWQTHRESLTTGFALKELLQRSPPAPQVASRAEAYIQSNRINHELNQDLRSALAYWKSRS